ncbi:MAG: YitT family protein [Faecalibacterium sp.]
MNGLKEAFGRENMVKDLNFFAKLNFGLLLTAIGIAWFKTPNHFAFGGTSGLSILLAAVFPQIDVGGFMWIINMVLVVLGFIFLGIRCMGWTIYSSFALSFYVSLCELLWPLSEPITGDVLLELIFAVLLPALGAAIVFDIGASTGGTDIVALILAKRTSMEIGTALMVSDLLIVLAAACKFGMATGLYCILGLVGKSFVVDGAIERIHLSKVCTVVTTDSQPVLDFIIEELNRSATVERAYGAYTHHDVVVVVTVLNRRQAVQLRNFLRANQPKAFITIVNSSEIIGKGFQVI